MKKILVIQTAFIGDVVLATALIENLHQQWPEVKMDILVRKGNESLFESHPFLNQVLVWDKKNYKYHHWMGLLFKIRSSQYDVVINAQRFAATGAWMALALRPDRRRMVWSTGWMAIVVAGVVLDAVGLQAPFPELAGPYAALLRLTPERTDSVVLPVWPVAIWPWILASGAWAGVLLTAKRLPRTASPANL